MNDIINKIKQTILKESQDKIVQNEKFVKIKEDAKDASLKAVEIHGFDKDDTFCSFSLDMEKFKTLSNYINRKNFNKGCDGVIVLIRESKLYFFLCELKSYRLKRSDYENQLKSSEAFIQYLIEAIKLFDNTTVKADSICIKKFLFCTKAQKDVTYSPNIKHKKPAITRIQCYEGDKTQISISQLLNG